MFLSQQADDRRRYEDERMYLEDQVEEERKRRQEAEQEASARMEAMQREIEELREQKTRTKSAAPSIAPSIMTLESTISHYLIPPPPTAAVTRGTPTPSPRRSLVPTRSPTPAKTPEKRTDQVIQDFLARVSMSFKNLAHGEGKQRSDLDKETKQKILQHKDDVKLAERQVFGRQLKAGEFDQLPHAEKLIKSDQIMAVIKELIQNRRNGDLKQGTKMKKRKKENAKNGKNKGKDLKSFSASTRVLAEKSFLLLSLMTIEPS
ncbi:hypothetical protein CAPTEDRAFT_186845 [Capitella teleta]|uniref:Uncharacterized protein n=1 Tax=Capitella teleta TaxID=283909 RepID=R7UDY7_CAPTE|nr:hypothetical protein CAPTEDRAFT_186845 [Capitella teleta]|eukprot:ELU01452.1 hypothetical protein CAPTEDRAFT_186845 [Capitella teleta]